LAWILSTDVSAQVRRYVGQQHGFIGLKPSAPYKQAIADIVEWLNEDIAAKHGSQSA
jgi:hypothetical protein